MQSNGPHKITNLSDTYCTFFIEAVSWEVASMVTVPPPDASPALPTDQPTNHPSRRNATTAAAVGAECHSSRRQKSAKIWRYGATAPSKGVL